jgi:RsiW-degrading membrane proteinase PrsW (M82 family)
MSIFLALILGFTPSLIWLAFFLSEDTHPEPKKMIAKAYILGGISALAALAIQYGLSGVLQQFSFTLPQLTGADISTFTIFAVVEEVVKFFFIYLLVRKSPYFDEPIDAMVYTITGALGFAAAENFFVVLSNGFHGVLGLIVLRFIGATLLHALASGIVGHHWARGIKYHIEGRMIVVGLMMASLFHVVFNLLVWEFNDFLIYPIAFLVLIGFFVLYDFEELKHMQ